jgi:hypothetical protein
MSKGKLTRQVMANRIYLLMISVLFQRKNLKRVCEKKTFRFYSSLSASLLDVPKLTY